MLTSILRSVAKRLDASISNHDVIGCHLVANITCYSISLRKHGFESILLIPDANYFFGKSKKFMTVVLLTYSSNVGSMLGGGMV